MKVLVDTSVWVAHFRQGDALLQRLLVQGTVVSHPHVVLEMACGTPPHRNEVLAWLGALEQMPLATHDEVLDLIRLHELHGKGCGLVDMHLLASARLGHARLWTHDRRLDALAQHLGVAFLPALDG